MKILGGLSVLVILLIGIFAILIPIIGIIAVIKDQNLDGSEKLLWLIVILIFNILGTVIYFVLRSNNR